MLMKHASKRSSSRYTRRSYFVDERAIRRARRVLGAETNAEAVRLAVERVIEMEDFWRFMNRNRARLKPGSIEVDRPR